MTAPPDSNLEGALAIHAQLRDELLAALDRLEKRQAAGGIGAEDFAQIDALAAELERSAAALQKRITEALDQL